MMQLIDTHAHLDDEQFDANRDDVIQRASKAGIANIICIGTTAKASRRCVEIAEEYQSVYAAVGIQPNYTAEVDDQDWSQIVELARHPKVVAIGETGLDYYWDNAPIDVQEACFLRHVQLSQQAKIPFVVHMREPQEGKDTPCSEHIYRVLASAACEGRLEGVMHSYTGNEIYAEKFMELGLMISFAGMVTYKKSLELRNVAKLIPDDRLLIETDAPYLSPHPQRGHRPNEPALVRLTAECLAEVRGVELVELAKMTTENARRTFRLFE